MQRLCVIGSLNIDLVATAEHFPQPGETVIGEFGTYPRWPCPECGEALRQSDCQRSKNTVKCECASAHGT